MIPHNPGVGFSCSLEPGDYLHVVRDSPSEFTISVSEEGLTRCVILLADEIDRLIEVLSQMREGMS